MIHYYAKLSGGRVTQTRVVADGVIRVNKTTVDEIRGSKLLVSLHGGKTSDYVRVTDARGVAGEGFRYDSEQDKFIAPQPFPSWVVNAETGVWESPNPKPSTGNYVWDEASVTWVPEEPPFVSWSWDNKMLRWVAPVAYPEDGGVYAWDEDATDWVVVEDV